MIPALIGWGSSSMALIGPAMDAALTPFGIGFVNEGRGGETSHHTAARIGSIPLPVAVEGGALPAAGTVRLLPTELDLVPLAESALRGRDAVLWMGKNDLHRGQDVEGVIERIVSSARFLEQAGGRVAVVGQFVNNGAEPALRDQVLAVNTGCAEHFGAAFLEVQEFLTSPALPEATGIAPSAEDLAERAAGAKPPSISTDPGHFDQLGNAAVATHLLTGLQRLGLQDLPTPEKETP